MFINCILHKIVARWAIQASLMSIVFVFFATITSSSFNVVVTGTLTLFIALITFRATSITIASFTTFSWESILVSFTFVAAWSSDSRLAEALTSVSVTRRVVRSNRVTFAVFTSVTTGNIPESILTFVTILTDHVLFAITITRDLVTNWYTVVSLNSTSWVARTGVARTMWQCVGISEMSGKTLIAMRACGVVNTFQAFSRCSVAVSNGVLIDISVTVTSLAKLNLSWNSSWVTKVSIRADLTSWSYLKSKISWHLQIFFQ